MSDQQPEMTRRNWFRLTKPVVPQDKLGVERQAGMQSIEEPVNHGGVDLASLPPMHEATLDSKEVASLFADLKRHATAVQLIARRAAGNSPDQSADLSSACDQLLGGKVRKLQIRYEWQNARWIDTLECLPNGFRLVRIQHV